MTRRFVLRFGMVLALVGCTGGGPVAPRDAGGGRVDVGSTGDAAEDAGGDAPDIDALDASAAATDGGTDASFELDPDFDPLFLARVERYVDGRDRSVYAPRHDEDEEGADELAFVGTVLVEAWKRYGDARYLERARAIGDSLIAHADEDGDGVYGWGKYYPFDPAHCPPGDEYRGGYTQVLEGCGSPNRAYQEALYPTAKVLRFLLELFWETDDARYLETSLRSIDDAWDFGAPIGAVKYYYWKYFGPCDVGWYIKNTNIAYGRSLALAVEILASPRGAAVLERGARSLAEYQLRAQHVQNAARWELSRTRSSGAVHHNYGYFGWEDVYSAAHETRVANVQALEPDADGVFRCTDSASCWQHLPIEALMLRELDRIRGTTTETAEAVIVLDEFRRSAFGACDALADDESKTYCTAYYCFLRDVADRFDRDCRDALASHSPGSLLVTWSLIYPLTEPLRGR